MNYLLMLNFLGWIMVGLAIGIGLYLANFVNAILQGIFRLIFILILKIFKRKPKKPKDMEFGIK